MTDFDMYMEQMLGMAQTAFIVQARDRKISNIIQMTSAVMERRPDLPTGAIVALAVETYEQIVEICIAHEKEA